MLNEVMRFTTPPWMTRQLSSNFLCSNYPILEILYETDILEIFSLTDSSGIVDRCAMSGQW